MKALLVALNAKYIHSNLGIYCLYAYSLKHGVSAGELEMAEYTINQNMQEILGDIYERKPTLIGFSCYIWNIEMIQKIACEVKKILPECKIWFGGPEVSFDARQMIIDTPWLDGIMTGDGEQTFLELLQYEKNPQSMQLKEIAGIVTRTKDGKVLCTKTRERLPLDEVVFPYQDMQKLEHRIVYYETSRGCPYGCSYCLSSVDKRVCFRSLEKVEKELQFFLDQKVPQVKFVDRTFNCNREHTMGIWKYIYEHDNGITNFHFELSADLLTEEEIAYVKQFRPGLVQFEIGVQSANEQTIHAIHRKMNLDVLEEKVRSIQEGGNIHQHLDLIAGLPYEDYDSFHQSFCRVYQMKPDQLQLGFLKVLKGSPMHQEAEQYGIVYSDFPPYEVLYTKWLSYQDILRLKGIEEMVERYYNSMQFQAIVPYLVQQFPDSFSFYEALSLFYKEKGYKTLQQSRMQNYEILYEFAEEKGFDLTICKELLTYDLYARENLKKEPAFLQKRERTKEEKEFLWQFFSAEEKQKKYFPDYEKYDTKQKIRMIHVEWFQYDILSFIATNQLEKKEIIVGFDYQKRNPLNYQAKVQYIE